MNWRPLEQQRDRELRAAFAWGNFSGGADEGKTCGCYAEGEERYGTCVHACAGKAELRPSLCPGARQKLSSSERADVSSNALAVQPTSDAARAPPRAQPVGQGMPLGPCAADRLVYDAAKFRHFGHGNQINTYLAAVVRCPPPPPPRARRCARVAAPC